MAQPRLRRDNERGDTKRVRRRHRGALQPAEAGSVDLEAGEVEQRRLERITTDEAVFGQRTQRAPAAVDDVAGAAVPAAQVEATRTAGGRETAPPPVARATDQ